jgi:putative superfamily III holin-X
MAVFAQYRQRSGPSFGELLREVTGDISALFRKEVELAKTELSEKAADVGRNVGAVAVGGAVLFAGGLALLAAVVNLVGWVIAAITSPELAVWLAPLLVGLALAFVGYGMVKKAIANLRTVSLAPEQTTQTLQENKEWLKEKIK